MSEKKSILKIVKKTKLDEKRVNVLFLDNQELAYSNNQYDLLPHIFKTYDKLSGNITADKHCQLLLGRCNNIIAKMIDGKVPTAHSIADYRVKIQQAISTQNTTASEVASKAGIASGTLYNFLSGKNISVENLQKILDALAESIINLKGKK